MTNQGPATPGTAARETELWREAAQVAEKDAQLWQERAEASEARVAQLVGDLRAAEKRVAQQDEAIADLNRFGVAKCAERDDAEQRAVRAEEALEQAAKYLRGGAPIEMALDAIDAALRAAGRGDEDAGVSETAGSHGRDAGGQGAVFGWPAGAVSDSLAVSAFARLVELLLDEAQDVIKALAVQTGKQRLHDMAREAAKLCAVARNMQKIHSAAPQVSAAIAAPEAEGAGWAEAIRKYKAGAAPSAPTGEAVSGAKDAGSPKTGYGASGTATLGEVKPDAE